MKKLLFINITAFIAAVSIFSGSVVFASAKINTAVSVSAVLDDDDFLQENETGIADLFMDSQQLSSSQVSFSSQDDISSKPVTSGKSTDYSNPESSRINSGKSSSGKIISSEKDISSESVSSEIISSEEDISSESASGEIISSEEDISSESESGEIISSEEDISSEEESDSFADSDYAGILDSLAGAVQREIIGVGTPLPKYYEAYKAQAVACHSYMEYHKSRTGSYPHMSYTKPNSKTVELVSGVLNELIYYDGTVINAAYHAASGRHTQSASAVWGGNIPYLIGVESAYDEYERTFTISAEEAEDKLSSAGINVSGDPDTWFDLTNATMSDGDFVSVINVCGMPVKCRTLRESVFGTKCLMSTKIIDISYDGANFEFTTLGFGHGVGMSQLGALGYAANEGFDYREIIKHYYSGVVVK